MRNIDLIVGYGSAALAVLFVFFLSENDNAVQWQVLQTKWQSHQDSISALFFIPSKANLKSEITFSTQMLEQLEAFGTNNTQADSIKRQVNEHLNQLKLWVIDLKRYDLSRFPKGKIKKALPQLPDFFRSGIEVLKTEEIPDLSNHIEKQKQFYWLLKKTFPERETQEARLALKEFIAFLTSVKFNQFTFPERENSKSLVNHQ